jgi:glycosyltransferase involved in cell wall biosynthesis
LKTSGHKVALCAWSRPIEGRCFDEFLKIDHIYVPSRLSKFPKGTLLTHNSIYCSALKQCIKNFKPCIRLNAVDDPAVFRVAPRDVKRVQYCHFLLELTMLYSFQKNDLKNLIGRLPYLYLLYRELEKLDAAVCNSSYTLNAARLLWKYYVSKEKFYVIHPAVETAFFAKEMKKEQKMCYVGRIVPEKGVEHAVEAFVKVYEKTGVSLEIAGSVAWNRAYFEGRIKPKVLKLQREGFPIKLIVDPPYSQIAETLLTSKVLVSFNPDEHFGIVPVEAQAAGCVPIVARGGGQEETVKHEITGFLSNSLGETLTYLSLLLGNDKLWIKMSRSAREWALNFSKENSTRKWNDLINKLTQV